MVAGADKLVGTASNATRSGLSRRNDWRSSTAVALGHQQTEADPGRFKCRKSLAALNHPIDPTDPRHGLFATPSEG